MRAPSLILLSTTAALIASGATAQTVDQAGADALEAQVPALVENVLQNAPDFSYSFNGPIEAVPAGESYELSIPMLRFEVDDDVRGEILPVEAIVTPLPNGWQRARWDFPSPIELVNPRNEDNTATDYLHQR
jgi:hypothetical protein